MNLWYVKAPKLEVGMVPPEGLSSVLYLDGLLLDDTQNLSPNTRALCFLTL